MSENRAVTSDIYRDGQFHCATLAIDLSLTACLDNQDQGRYGRCPCNLPTMPTREGYGAYLKAQQQPASEQPEAAARESVSLTTQAAIVFRKCIFEDLPVFRPTADEIKAVALPWLTYSPPEGTYWPPDDHWPYAMWWSTRSADVFMGGLTEDSRAESFREMYSRHAELRLDHLADHLIRAAGGKAGSCLDKLVAVLRAVEDKGQRAGLKGLSNEMLWLALGHISSAFWSPDIEALEDWLDRKRQFRKQTQAVNAALSAWGDAANAIRPLFEASDCEHIDKCMAIAIELETDMEEIVKSISDQVDAIEHINDCSYQDATGRVQRLILRCSVFNDSARYREGKWGEGVPRRPTWPEEKRLLARLAALLQAAGFTPSDVAKHLSKFLGEGLPGVVTGLKLNKSALRTVLNKKELKDYMVTLGTPPAVFI